jgi:2'-5' RNA ligase
MIGERGAGFYVFVRMHESRRSILNEMRTGNVVAVDVVVLPPAAVARRALAANRMLSGDLRLGPRALPHLTLAMAAVPAAALPAIARDLRTLARQTRPFEITLTGAVARRRSRHVTAWYEARRTRALLTLHRRSLEILSPHRRRRVTAAAFARPGGVGAGASARRWVARFEEDASHARFLPHLTLGYGAPAPEAESEWPLKFPARRLALCHLGPHCTCARVLAEARLPR